jgi:hypothetical protein
MKKEDGKEVGMNRNEGGRGTVGVEELAYDALKLLLKVMEECVEKMLN